MFLLARWIFWGSSQWATLSDLRVSQAKCQLGCENTNRIWDYYCNYNGIHKKSYGIIIYYNPKNLGFQDFGTLGLKYWGFNWRFATSTKMLQPFTHDATFRSFSAVAQPISWARHDRYRNPCQLPVSNLSAIEPTPMAQLPAVRFFPLWKSAV